MMTFYRATAERCPDGVLCTLSSRADNVHTWQRHITQVVSSFDRAQDLMDQWQLQRGVVDFGFERSIDTRGVK